MSPRFESPQTRLTHAVFQKGDLFLTDIETMAAVDQPTLHEELGEVWGSEPVQDKLTAAGYTTDVDELIQQQLTVLQAPESLQDDVYTRNLLMSSVLKNVANDERRKALWRAEDATKELQKAADQQARPRALGQRVMAWLRRSAQ